ncbi:MAG: hypothetical protein LiPW39_392 [Parcubacteria group bacterium LiPW_39]|nr:MAG: hypothetical protein LiPW39_392 [Parcubacteria group bacterium LiPW_39]
MRAIEFAGTICAGKMTLLEEIKRELPGNIETETIAQDLVIHVEMEGEGYFERQVWLANDVTNRLLRFRKLQMSNLVVLVHRGLYDAQAFMMAYVKANLVPPARARPQIAAWEANAKSLTDFVILVKTPVEIAFQRAKRKFATLFRLKDRDAVFEQKFFEALDQAYAELERKLPSKSSLVVDGSKPVKENKERILEAIAQLLKPEKGLTPEVNSQEEGGAGWKMRIGEKSLIKKMALT